MQCLATEMINCLVSCCWHCSVKPLHCITRMCQYILCQNKTVGWLLLGPAAYVGGQHAAATEGIACLKSSRCDVIPAATATFCVTEVQRTSDWAGAPGAGDLKARLSTCSPSFMERYFDNRGCRCTCRLQQKKHIACNCVGMLGTQQHAEHDMRFEAWYNGQR